MVDESVTLPPKAPVVGTPISLTSYDDVIELLRDRPRDRATVIAVCNVHSVMSARRDEQLARALRDAEVATSDGMPLVWALRWVEPWNRLNRPIIRMMTYSPGWTPTSWENRTSARVISKSSTT